MLLGMTLECAYLSLKVFKLALLLLIELIRSKHYCKTASESEEVI